MILIVRGTSRLDAWEASLAEREKALEAYQCKEFFEFAIRHASDIQMLLARHKLQVRANVFVYALYGCVVCTYLLYACMHECMYACTLGSVCFAQAVLLQTWRWS